MKDDSVAHPAHYTRGKIEVWDFIVDQGLDYLEGNVVKYVCRHRHKGASLQDLQKARAYLGRLIRAVEDTPSGGVVGKRIKS